MVKFSHMTYFKQYFDQSMAVLTLMSDAVTPLSVYSYCLAKQVMSQVLQAKIENKQYRG